MFIISCVYEIIYTNNQNLTFLTPFDKECLLILTFLESFTDDVRFNAAKPSSYKAL